MEPKGIPKPEQIRLIHLKTRRVRWHDVDDTLPWKHVWTISHVWDRPKPPISTQIPLDGVSWESTSFSSVKRFQRMFDKTLELVEPLGAEYVWLDAACINQGKGAEQDLERKIQIPFAGTIYAQSAGCVGFGTLAADDGFVEIVSTSKNSQEAWVCDWFERVWTFQELKLPKKLFFVSGDHVLTRDQLYFRILMMSPYLTSLLSPPLNPNDAHISAQEVVNALSPALKFTTQRLLMQTSKRGCNPTFINDKIYGMLGVLPESLSKPNVDYSISLEGAVLDLMLLMSKNDVLDTLTFNTLPTNDIHDAVHWSGMVRLDGPPTEHPSYEKDVYPSETTARVVVGGNPPLAYTVVNNTSLWRVKVTEARNTHADTKTPVRAWPSISTLVQYFNFKSDFSKVQPSKDYAHAVGRAERSLAANWTLLEPLLKEAAKSDIAKEFWSILENKPSNDEPRGIPPNRFGDENQFDKVVTVLHCRSKEDKSFHYGIVMEPNDDADGTWHKVCTAAFSDSCVVDRERVEELVVIGK